MASPARQILARLEGTAPPPMQPPALPGEILREILLRVASPADLARAAMACASFRGFIAEPSFRRRYRSLHPPLLLGFLDGEFRPTQAPHPCAPAGRAFVRAAYFDFDRYVPRNGWHGWGTCDLRDGRVLLKYGMWMNKEGFVGFPDLAVCDPLSRRYLLLPPIPDGLLASVQVRERDIRFFDASMVPSRAGDDDTAFRVMGTAHWLEKLVVLIFSSCTGGWSIAAPTTWEALSLIVPQNGRVLEYGRGYFAYGCYYRKVSENKLLRFNMNTAEFSTLELPPRHEKLEIFIIEAGRGRLGVVSLSQINAQTIRHSILQTNGGQRSIKWKMANIVPQTIRHSILQNNGGQRSTKWKMANIVPLPADYFSVIVGAFGGYIFISGYPKTGNTMDTHCLSLDIRTLKIKMIGRNMGLLHGIHPYFGYPPSMSPRRI